MTVRAMRLAGVGFKLAKTVTQIAHSGKEGSVVLGAQCSVLSIPDRYLESDTSDCSDKSDSSDSNLSTDF